MTAIAVTNHNRLPAWPFVIVALVLGATLVLPQVTATVHSQLHDEAAIIRQCYADGKINQIWINSSGERFNCLVDMPDGRIGDQVQQWCKRSGWIIVTSYVIGDGTLAEAVRVLKEKACARVY